MGARLAVGPEANNLQDPTKEADGLCVGGFAERDKQPTALDQGTPLNNAGGPCLTRWLYLVMWLVFELIKLILLILCMCLCLGVTISFDSFHGTTNNYNVRTCIWSLI